MTLAQRFNKHVDFHLDYNIDPEKKPLIHEVISQAKSRSTFFRPPNSGPMKRITIGHATRLQLFDAAEWYSLSDAIGDLPISFVSLPQSDIYMLGPDDPNTDPPGKRTHKPLGHPRGTLNVPDLAKRRDIYVAMSVNNLENAFTPQGSLDPLSLCTFGVAIFQTALHNDLVTLLVRLMYFRSCFHLLTATCSNL